MCYFLEVPVIHQVVAVGLGRIAWSAAALIITEVAGALIDTDIKVESDDIIIIVEADLQMSQDTVTTLAVEVGHHIQRDPAAGIQGPQEEVEAPSPRPLMEKMIAR
jgi:hypothetical protein